jgi:hypothetical protein
MKIGAALAADLGILTAALDEPGADLLHSLHQLGVDAQAAVPTYLGLSVTVDGSDPPFTFTTLEDGAADDVRTSLWLTLPGVTTRPRTRRRLVRRCGRHLPCSSASCCARHRRTRPASEVGSGAGRAG